MAECLALRVCGLGLSTPRDHVATQAIRFWVVQGSGFRFMIPECNQSLGFMGCQA